MGSMTGLFCAVACIMLIGSWAMVRAGWPLTAFQRSVDATVGRRFEEAEHWARVRRRRELVLRLIGWPIAIFAVGLAAYGVWYEFRLGAARGVPLNNLRGWGPPGIAGAIGLLTFWSEARD